MAANDEAASPDPEPPVHFCGVTASEMAVTSAWRKRRLSWFIDGVFPTLSEEDAHRAISEAFASWQAACGLVFVEASDADECDILITTGRIDGAFGVLAWSQLPQGDDRQLRQKYDSKDKFVIAISPPRGSIDLVAVACHEIGHALGLEHTSPGTGDLMEPTYAAGRRVPQPGDVARIVRLYGPPVAVPSPSPPSGGNRVASRMVILDQDGGVMARYDIKRTD